MKLYEIVHEKDGSIKVVTELTPDDINAMLELALMGLLHQGIAPRSIAHHFMPPEQAVNEINDKADEAAKADKKSGVDVMLGENGIPFHLKLH